MKSRLNGHKFFKREMKRKKYNLTFRRSFFQLSSVRFSRFYIVECDTKGSRMRVIFFKTKKREKIYYRLISRMKILVKLVHFTATFFS